MTPCVRLTIAQDMQRESAGFAAKRGDLLKEAKARLKAAKPALEAARKVWLLQLLSCFEVQRLSFVLIQSHS